MVRCNHFVRRFPNKVIQQAWFSWRSIFSPLIDFGSRKLIHSPSTTKLKVIKNVEVLRCSQVRCWGGFPKRKCAKSQVTADSIFWWLQSCTFRQIIWNHILIVNEHQIRVWGMIFFSLLRTFFGTCWPGRHDFFPTVEYMNSQWTLSTLSKVREKPHWGFVKCFTRWWFQILSIFNPTWGNDPTWLIFFKWVETTNRKFCLGL